MATRKQKQELIDTLKFIPIKCNILIQGYGGETYAGTVTREEYEAYKQGQVDLDQYAMNWDEDDKWNDIPERLRIFSPGSPYDCDGLWHESGATMDDGSYITIEDENGATIFNSSLNIADLTKRGVNVVLSGDVDTDDMEDGTIIFWGGQGEKGCFYDGKITLRSPFDPAKLTVFYSNCDGWLLSGGIEYDGEDAEGYDGYSTTGKWTEHKFYIVGDEEVYQGEERDECEDESEEDEESNKEWDPAEELAKIDVPILENEEMWAQRVIDESMYSPWHPGNLKPVHRGFYDVEYEAGSWPWPIEDRIEWTGKRWKHNRGDETELKRWRGLNQPAE